MNTAPEDMTTEINQLNEELERLDAQLVLADELAKTLEAYQACFDHRQPDDDPPGDPAGMWLLLLKALAAYRKARGK